MEYLYLFYGLAYFLGSIPFGLLLSKLILKTDLTKIGSGNIGATNVLRTGNKTVAALTLALDILKGALAVVVTVMYFWDLPECQRVGCPSGMRCSCLGEGGYEYFELYLLPAFFAVLGHCYPVWLKFKGGKGVATTFGVLLAAVPVTGVVAALTWLVSALIGRISSLAAISAMIVAPAITYSIYGLYPSLMNVAISLLVLWRHRENIKRLRAGEEPKIGSAK